MTQQSDHSDELSDSNVTIDWKESEMETIFQLFDSKNKGEVQSEELKLIIRGFGIKLTDREIVNLTGLDENERDKLTAKTFPNFVHRIFPDQVRYDDVKHAFKLFDQSGSGIVTREDLRCMMTKWSREVTEAELDDMMEEVDQNGDGVIDFKEFLKALMTS